jgi:hypothetical protein
MFATRKESNVVLFDYIGVYYNWVRRHCANRWLSPEAFEQKYFKNLEGSLVHDTVYDHQNYLDTYNLRTGFYGFYGKKLIYWRF